jgi:hypothetical protein
VCKKGPDFIEAHFVAQLRRPFAMANAETGTDNSVRNAKLVRSLTENPVSSAILSTYARTGAVFLGMQRDRMTARGDSVPFSRRRSEIRDIRGW